MQKSYWITLLINCITVTKVLLKFDRKKRWQRCSYVLFSPFCRRCEKVVFIEFTLHGMFHQSRFGHYNELASSYFHFLSIYIAFTTVSFIYFMWRAKWLLLMEENYITFVIAFIDCKYSVYQIRLPTKLFALN